MPFTIDAFIQCIKNNYDASDSKRAYAWFDCNEAFGNDTLSADDKAKELYRFLANWGMLHNSFLMGYNWRILRGAVGVLSEAKYKPLRNPEASELMKAENLDLAVELSEEIDKSLREFHGDKSVSMTLVTKILLGTMACSVAYDETVRKVLPHLPEIGAPARFGRNSIRMLCEFYEREENKEKLESLRTALTDENHPKCPPLKILDLGLVAWKEQNGI